MTAVSAFLGLLVFFAIVHGVKAWWQSDSPAATRPQVRWETMSMAELEGVIDEDPGSFLAEMAFMPDGALHERYPRGTAHRPRSEVQAFIRETIEHEQQMARDAFYSYKGEGQ